MPVNAARSALLLCARQELTLAVRSRWTQTFALVFAALSLGVSLSGYILSGGSGVQEFARTAVSLVQLVLLLVPVTALVIGVLALAPDRGAAELLFSQPVARWEILLGKLLGLFEALLGAQALGFGASGLVIFSQSGSEGVTSFVALVGGSAILTAVFLGIAALIAAGSPGRRARSLALALVVWFVAVVMFDLAALGVASLLRSGHASRVLITAVLVNPVDAVRTGTLLAVEGTAAFGAASLALLRFTGGAMGAAVLLAGSLATWMVVPVALAAHRLSRADL
jgi:Cu-processing system permease protein